MRPLMKMFWVVIILLGLIVPKKIELRTPFPGHIGEPAFESSGVLPISGPQGPKNPLCPEWPQKNLPEDLYADPKLGNCRIHPNPSHIAVVCDYLTYKSVCDDFLTNPKFQYFRTGSSTKY